MSERPTAVAYVFFHAPAPTVAPASYEAGLAAFHRSLAEHPSEGFVESASYRVARVPFAPSPFGAVAYADWYVVRDFAALQALEGAAIEPPHRSPHDAVAGLAGPATGAIYALRAGAPALERVRFERWIGKARGVPSASVVAELSDGMGDGGSVWQRQMALGPAPEFCRRSIGRPAGAPPAEIVEVRPVARSGGR